MTALATQPSTELVVWSRGNEIKKSIGNSSLARQIMSDCQKQIVGAMPRTAAMRFERFVRQALLALSRNPKLLECSRESFLGAVMEAANLGLDPSGGVLGEAHLVPFAGEIKLMPGYRGLCVLARRAGGIVDIWAEVVYEFDSFREIKGSEHKILHESGIGKKSDDRIIGAYMCANLGNGAIHPHFVDRDYIEKCRKVSKTGSREDGPWKIWFAEMCKKTAVRSGIKMLPISSEVMAHALELADQDFEYSVPPSNESRSAKYQADETRERIQKVRSTSAAESAPPVSPPASKGDVTTQPEDAGGGEPPIDEDSASVVDIDATLAKPWPQVIEFLWATAEKGAFVPERESFDKWLQLKVKVGAGKFGKESEIKLAHKQAWYREIMDGKAFK